MSYLIKNFVHYKNILSFLTLLVSSQLIYSQVTGPSPVEANSTHTYYFDDGLFHKKPLWLIDGGTRLSFGTVGTEYYVNVQWDGAGIGTVTISSGMILLGGKSVTIGSSTPSAPPIPTITNYPGYTRLTRSFAPIGEQYYWQSSATGTSTTNSASYVDRTSGSVYYIRSYKSSTNGWSSATTINYTINPPSGILSGENYIHTINPTIETTNVSLLTIQEKTESITYFDGLGRPMQSIGIRAGGSSEDIITHIGYDGYGRQDKDYLPYTASSNGGSIRLDALGDTKTFYDASKYEVDFPGMTTVTINPYSEKALEASPLNRVFKQAAPGYDWRLNGGHEIKFDYQTNILNEVKLYRVTLSYANNTYTPTLSLSGSYTAGELYKTITKDENWTSGTNHTTEEFKDKQGQVILKRTYNNGVAHDTYYVYDDYGNLSFVLPPKAEPQTALPDATELSELCYQYKYDHRNRLVEKKIPGKGWEYIVYNKLDQPILIQDPNLQTQNKWLFTKYDAFGRVAYTGEMTRNISRINLQTEVNNISSQYVTKQSTSTIIDGTTIYYNNGAYPTGYITDILTINYYDNYTFDKVSGNSETSYTVTPITNVKGLTTGSKVRVLGTNDWITTVNYYDAKSRPIYNYSYNSYLTTTDKVKSKLDFVGKVEETTTTHARTSFSMITTVDKYAYDHQGRLLTQKNKINSLAEEVIVENIYDDLGQLITKGVGGKTTQSRLQTVNYNYNIRGWLKGINNENGSNSAIALGVGDLFGLQINYNNPSSGTQLFNGNISQTLWKTTSVNNTANPVPNKYSYSYDALNRITGATDNLSRYTLSGLQYDKNGNIITLIRGGHTNVEATTFGTMDNLAYLYGSGNQLLSVSDSSLKTQGFDDGNVSGNDYSYDPNGNLLSDANKGITSVTYNHLNMPTEIKFNNSSTQKINYTYAADRTKLRKVKTEGANVTTTDYATGFVYENNILKQFNQPEGYIEPNGSGGYSYVYNYTDQVGNVRLSYSDLDGNGLINPGTEILKERNFYPFGLEHKGYNNGVNGTESNYKTFQGQELTKDLGLNTIEFKYRMHDPAIGRFWQVDPLADKYRFNSPYAFSENRVINGRELEGLEYAFYSYNGRQQEQINKATAQVSKEEQDQANSMKMDVIPVLGDAKGFVEAFTGSDLITGEKLGGFSRLLGLVFLSEFRTVGKTTDAARTLAKNYKIGKKGEKVVTDALKKEFKGDNVLSQVTGKFEDGTTTILDNVVIDAKTGKIKLVGETKTGNAKLTKQQERFYSGGESIELVGDNSKSLKGQTINSTDVNIRSTTVDRKLLEENQ